MSGREDRTSQATHVADQLPAAETPTEQIAQMAEAVAVTMDKIAAVGEELAEHAAQLRNLNTWLRQGAAGAERQAPARLHAANGTRRPLAGKREIAATPHNAVVIPLQFGPAVPADHQDLAEVTPAAPYAHREQELDLLDWTISNLYHIGLILLPAASQHSDSAQGAAEAIQCLDDTICRLRDHVLNAHANGR